MPLSTTNQQKSDIEFLIEHYQLTVLPLEGNYYRNTFTSTKKLGGNPMATAMIGLYSHQPLSQSNFHRLDHDEIWHFYKGDPFSLYLLGTSGHLKEVKMGTDFLAGEHLQYVVPARTWQGACLLPNSSYALFGCTMAPGFTAACFELAQRKDLIAQYPDHLELITKLTTTVSTSKLAQDFDKK